MKSPGLWKQWWWRIADPALLTIGSRLRHLRSLEAKIDLDELSAMATVDRTVRLASTAKIFGLAPPGNIVVGAHCFVEGELAALTKNARLSIGHHCTVGANTRIWAQQHIEIGDYVMISHSVDIHDSDSHPLDATLRRDHAISSCEAGGPLDMTSVSSAPVRIEDDVWIGFKASILKGVTIGRGAVVAAGALVTRDAPPHALVAGNPAKVVRMLA